MAVQGDRPSPDRGSFDKATVDRRQVFGGLELRAAADQDSSVALEFDLVVWEKPA